MREIAGAAIRCTATKARVDRDRVSSPREDAMRRCVVLGLGLVACGGGKAALDPADLQAKVAAEASKRVGVQAASATCPAASPAAGSSFECNVSFQGGGALPFKVDQIDATGSISIAPKGDWLLGDV